MMGGYGMSGWGGGLGFGMGFGWLVPLVVIGLVVWAVVAFTRSHSARGGATEAGPDRSLEILKERYAKGELDADTYQRMRKELKH